MKLNDEPGTAAGAGARKGPFIVLAAVGAAPHQGVVDILAEAGMDPQDTDAAEGLSRGVRATTGHARGASAPMPLLPPEAAETVGAPSQWLEQASDAHVLVLYTRPEAAVARAMDQGQPPSQPLDEWCRQVEDLLRLYRRNRRRVTLLDADAATAAPETCVRNLENRLQVRLARPSQVAARDLTEPEAVLQAIAALAVQQSETVQDLYAELEASALPLAAPADLNAPDIDRAFTDYMTGRDQTESLRRELDQQREHAAQELSKTQEAQAKQLEEQKQENELLLTQLHQVREELESYYLKAKEADEQLADTRQALEAAKTDAQDKQNQLTRLQEEQEQLQDRLAQAEADLAGKEDLQQENELLLQQLHQVQEELESYYLEDHKNAKALQELKDKLAAREQTIKNKNWAIDKKEEKYQATLANKKQLERDLKATRARLERIKQSASWKVTAPVRAVRRPFATKPEKTRNA